MSMADLVTQYYLAPKRRVEGEFEKDRTVSNLPIRFTLRLMIAVTTALLLTFAPAAVQAKIYKYKQDGVWHFTDDPARVPARYLKPAATDETAAAGRQAPKRQKPAPSKLPRLLENFPAANAIERAAAATVAVEGAAGYGSGFFITAQGHIITNKHVVRPVVATTARQEKYFTDTRARMKEISRRLETEGRRLERAGHSLERMAEITAKQTDPNLKRAYRDQYNDDLATYRSWKADYRQRKKRFEAEKAKFDEQHRQYAYRKSVASLSRTFTIYLADRSRFYVRLEAVSRDHDLALLKLDGYQTPCLEAAPDHSVTQGQPVYAIGNPVKLHNSVTSGVFSGYENGYLQTNAQIYPGNSGGPLVDQKGRVLGINTFKKLTRKFEGLGFAIPIEIVWQDFSAYLPALPAAGK